MLFCWFPSIFLFPETVFVQDSRTIKATKVPRVVVCQGVLRFHRRGGRWDLYMVRWIYLPYFAILVMTIASWVGFFVDPNRTIGLIGLIGLVIPSKRHPNKIKKAFPRNSFQSKPHNHLLLVVCYSHLCHQKALPRIHSSCPTNCIKHKKTSCRSLYSLKSTKKRLSVLDCGIAGLGWEGLGNDFLGGRVVNRLWIIFFSSW